MIYNNPSKKQRENETISCLLKNLEIQKYNEPIKCESPDFLLTINECTIGIEVTQLIKSSDTNMMAIKNAQEEALRKTVALLDKNQIGPIEVIASFRDDKLPIDKEVVANDLFQLVLENLDKRKDTNLTTYFRCPNSNFFSEIGIRHGKFGDNQWLDHNRIERRSQNWVATRAHKPIQKAIDRKQKKLNSYLKKCDICWLALCVNERAAPEAIAVLPTDKTCYYSDFTRVFFVRIGDCEVVELPIRKWIPENERSE